MFTWNADKIRFLRDASEYTPFNYELASRAAEYFTKNAHVCDAGCGLGYLSLALSKQVLQVTAVDTSQEALSVLRENLVKHGVSNVATTEADVFSLPQEMLFDGMAFCFFGGTEQILRCVQAHCRGKAVLFKKNWASHRFTAKQTPLARFTFMQTCDELTTMGVPFEAKTFALDMGQPFRSIADARRFFALYERENYSAALTEAELRARLIQTGSDAFPYYLSADRPVGMIVVDAGSIPEAIKSNEGINK